MVALGILTFVCRMAQKPLHKSRNQRAVAAMLIRWQRDLLRLQTLLGEYSQNEFSDTNEIQRNLDTAIAYAKRYITPL
jgi:ferric iron reductase protein FhuF